MSVAERRRLAARDVAKEQKHLVKAKVTAYVPDNTGNNDTVFLAYKTRPRSVPPFVYTDTILDTQFNRMDAKIS